MKKLILLLLFIPLVTNSQDIKWTTISKIEYNPDQLISQGIITLDNGDKTPEADLYIDFEEEKFFIETLLIMQFLVFTKKIFRLFLLNEYQDGKSVKDGAFFGDVGDQIAASLRKKTL